MFSHHLHNPSKFKNRVVGCSFFFYGTSFSQNYVTLAKEASPSNCTAHLINTIVFKTKGRKAFATVYMFPIPLLRLSVSNIQIDSLSP